MYLTTDEFVKFIHICSNQTIKAEGFQVETQITILYIWQNTRWELFLFLQRISYKNVSFAVEEVRKLPLLGGVVIVNIAPSALLHK